jgi:hypothetical protein
MRRFTLDIVSTTYTSFLIAENGTLTLLCFVVTTGKIMTVEELNNVKGRAWEDVDH